MYIDTRDLNKRLEELEDMLSRIDDIKDEMEDPERGSEDHEDLAEELNFEVSEFDKDEYDNLCSMREDIPEWEHGNTLVPDDNWVMYVEEMIKDTHDNLYNMPWYIEINWKATANHIQQDHSCVEYEGEDYWYRNC